MISPSVDYHKPANALCREHASLRRLDQLANRPDMIRDAMSGDRALRVDGIRPNRYIVRVGRSLGLAPECLIKGLVAAPTASSPALFRIAPPGFGPGPLRL